MNIIYIAMLTLKLTTFEQKRHILNNSKRITQIALRCLLQPISA